MADDLKKPFPENTIVQFSYLPTLRAQLALTRHDAISAVSTLEAAEPYELGLAGGMYPAYVRGQAHLALRQGLEASPEFQKILDHRGVELNDTMGALAYLALASAHVLQGGTAKPRAAYLDFLTLWKGADADIPILIAAKAAYANLK